MTDVIYNSIDYKIIDLAYSQAYADNRSVKAKNQVVHLNITDSTYDYLHSNYLSRSFLAEINRSLGKLEPAAVMYDLIFAFPGNPSDDSLFASSLSEAKFYLPVGPKLENTLAKAQSKNAEILPAELASRYLLPLKTINEGSPYFVSNFSVQYSPFWQNCYGSGHIGIKSDPDGIFRHIPLIVRYDSLYLPSISLAMILDYYNIPFDSVRINFGNEIVIPYRRESLLTEPLRIPIDETGSCFIPFRNRWENMGEMIDIQNFHEYSRNIEHFNSLSEIIEGNFVMIADVSTGISDLGSTPLEDDVPLIVVHSAMTDAMLNNSFFYKWSKEKVILIFLAGCFFIVFGSLFKRNYPIYISSVAGFCLFQIYLFSQFNNAILLPAATLNISLALVFILSIVSLQVIGKKQEVFIKNAFAMYVPDKIVEILVENPGMLKLGGEERIVTMLFSDLTNFTGSSEKVSPKSVVGLLNSYFTEMTEIIMNENGIVDKFLGDGILAEFGAPVYCEDHADRAVSAAINMKKRLQSFNANGEKAGFSDIGMRIGINSGNVILGNIGSKKVFDYTVIGDNVNLAARLESVNKVYATEILISESTFSLINKSKYFYRPIDIIQVKGKTEPIEIYEIFSFSNDLIEEKLKDLFKKYSEAIQQLKRIDLEQAKHSFELCLEIKPDDVPSALLLERVNGYINSGEIINNIQHVLRNK